MTDTPHPLPPPSAAMQRSLALAAQAVGLSNPNPAVGCVLIAPGGQCIGQGHTQAVGGPHAEVMALRDAAARGHSVQGATAYVTLEPCAHHGRTPPCCDALITAGVGKVVAALVDPHPQVAGQGLARLRAAGIAVELGDGAAQAAELNLGFLQRMRTGRPWLRSKIAASLDGLTALPDGQSQWITGPQARSDGQHWRQRACVVLTGVGTVLADDPLLNVRETAAGSAARQPHLAIVDSRLRTPPGARLWQAPGRQVWLFASAETANDVAQRQRQQALQALGARVVLVAGTPQGLDLEEVVQHLARMPANEVHVEAGATLNGALLRAGLIDECLLYLAPKLLGTGRPMAAGLRLEALEQAPDWHWLDRAWLGADLRLRLSRRPLGGLIGVDEAA
ncbi:MAG: bifunctional diaminohydroxyphosphoribosylaminopyrimidine deaminase/5-amino-6-(5-phosphoribosylamino)uracil reductase RibD [Comamonadaceae bacterium]|nr:bifunctional diaminohydroxyphosphoribosylaminopyrimidine deaminase/5-amino-6-(5-phosphoribosylamino)uracil reductase RibD [Comamonadaceae bacterium]